jgi:hypothetical protein
MVATLQLPVAECLREPHQVNQTMQYEQADKRPAQHSILLGVHRRSTIRREILPIPVFALDR